MAYPGPTTGNPVPCPVPPLVTADSSNVISPPASSLTGPAGAPLPEKSILLIRVPTVPLLEATPPVPLHTGGVYDQSQKNAPFFDEEEPDCSILVSVLQPPPSSQE